MTALEQYQRLEATGLWRPTADAQRREVVVSLGEASLTLTDLSDRVLGHWSLAAVARATPREVVPALYHPDADPDEVLELGAEASDMIAALDRIIRAVERRRPRPGKLRVWLTAGAVVAMVAAGALWLPGALLDYATRVVPEVKRQDIGAALLNRIARVAGAPCSQPEADAALSRLARRVLGPAGQNALVVLPGGLATTAHLPGGRILLNRSVVEDPDDPDVTAGYVLAEAVRAATDDPLEGLLRQAGLGASLSLLTTGDLPPGALDAYAEYLVTAPPQDIPDATLLAAFAAAEIRATPYAYARDVTGETTIGLIEADPRRGTGSREVLSDADWVRLQSICGG